MDKLLPCPFCGLPPYTIEQTGIIICQTPDCPKVEALTPEEWNRRAPGEAPAPTPDELTFEDAPPRNIVGTVRARFREVPPAPPEALDLATCAEWLEQAERTGAYSDMSHPALVAWAKAGYPGHFSGWVCGEIARRLRSLPPSEGAGT